MANPLVTLFASRTAADIAAARAMSLSEFERMIREATPAKTKSALPLFKLARFGDNRSDAGLLRHDMNVLEVHGIEADYDGEQMSMADATERVRTAGVQALFYTTASHAPDKPRWHAVCPLAAPLTGTVQELREKRRYWVGVLNAILGGVLKAESFVLSQCFYFGGIEGRPDPETVIAAGVCIDELPAPPEPVYPTARDAGATARPATPDDSRSADLYRQVGAAVDAGLDDDAIHAQFNRHPHAADQKSPARAVQRCIDKARDRHVDGPKAEILTLVEMLQNYVFIARGPMVIDRNNAARKWRLPEFDKRFAASLVRSDERVSPATRLWLTHAHRLTADDLDFDPGLPRFYHRSGQSVFNMWEPPTWPDGDVALASPFLEHVTFLVAEETVRGEFLDWLAAVAQQPSTRPHFHYLMIAQTQGIGRSWLADLLVALWSEQYVTDTDLAKVISKQFNSELSRKLVVVIHETKAPAGEHFAYRDRLKSLLTDTRITINEKNLPVWVEKFCARLLMFTNNVNALPVTESDRRVCVIQNPATPRSPEYYTQLYATLRDREFLASVWALFRTRDLSRYNPGAIARITAAKERMAEDSRTEEQRIAIAFVRAAPFDCILAPDLAEVLVPSDTLHESKKERHLRISAVTRVLQDIGICTADRKLYVEGQPRNVWILRDVDSWRSASAAKLHEAVELTRAELQKHNWKVVTALEAWTRSEPAITAPNKPDFDPGS